MYISIYTYMYIYIYRAGVSGYRRALGGAASREREKQHAEALVSRIDKFTVLFCKRAL